MTINRADAEAILFKGPQQEEKGDNKESGRRGYTDHGARNGMRRATIQTADAEPILIKGPQREEKGDNKKCWRRGYTDHVPPEGGEGRL